MYVIAGAYGWENDYGTYATANEPRVAFQYLYKIMQEGMYEFGLITDGQPANTITGKYPANTIGYARFTYLRGKEVLMYTCRISTKGFGYAKQRYAVMYDGQIKQILSETQKKQKQVQNLWNTVKKYLK